ncbi:MAG: protein kinase [Acidobacteriota bacterium]
MTTEKLGRYEIIEELGKGAMGLVYLARDPLIGRQLALKTFRLGYSAKDEELEQFRARFLREAQSAGILSHPNIVTIHDVVVDDGGDFFIAMEYVKGTDLKQLMQRQTGRLELRFVVDIVAQIADGLHYAHSKGVVHRDIKPANIIITAEKKAKITDFGIARVDASNLTVEGQLLGTPNYMAPEQIQGKEVDHRADLFALGVMLYEMVTTKKPFAGENLTVVTHRIVYDSFTPPDEILPGLPPRLMEILDRALRKAPDERYQSGADLAADLRALFEPVERPADRTTASFLTDVEDTPAPAVPPVPGAGGSTATAAPPSAGPPPAAGAPRAASSGPTPTLKPQTPPFASAPAAVPPRYVPPVDQGSSPARRGLLLASLGVLLLVVVGTVGFFSLRSSGGSDVVHFDPEEELRKQVEPLLEEGRAAIAAGEPVRAIEVFDQALVVKPGDPTIRELRDRAEKMLLDGDLTREEQILRDRLDRAEESLTAREFQEAIDTATSVLELAPENERAADLLARAEDGKRRRDEARRAVKDRFNRGAGVAAGGDTAAATDDVPAAEQTATLAIDFYSETSEGIFTVYVGTKQFFKENFKFTAERSGFLRRPKKIPGGLSHSGEVQAGTHSLRVYVYSNGATEARELEGNFPPEQLRTLKVRVDEAGIFSAQLE